MIDKIIQDIKNIITSDTYKAVYSSFDSIPYYSKNSEISTYVGISEFETKTPIYALNTIFIPFSAAAEISLAAPMDCSADVLFTFFSDFIMSKLGDSDYHMREIKSLIIKPDTNIKKLVLKCEFCISGMIRKENTSSEQS